MKQYRAQRKGFRDPDEWLAGVIIPDGETFWMFSPGSMVKHVTAHYGYALVVEVEPPFIEIDEKETTHTIESHDRIEPIRDELREETDHLQDEKEGAQACHAPASQPDALCEVEGGPRRAEPLHHQRGGEAADASERAREGGEEEHDHPGIPEGDCRVLADGARVPEVERCEGFGQATPAAS